MIKYECFYKNSSAGYLEVDEPLRDQEMKCRFMPNRSKAHLRIVELVKGKNKPIAKFKSDNHTVEAEIIELLPDSITLGRQRDCKKNPLKKLFSFLMGQCAIL